MPGQNRERATCRTCSAPLHEGTIDGLCPACVGRSLFVVEPGPGPEEVGIAIDDAAGASDGFPHPGVMALGAGSVIGRYTLLEKIGEGGFGVVYRAEQHEPIAREVALKVIKRGMDTDQVVARFEAERQALALMDHPNIAKVFDAGATQSGRPYFVMELVRGESITAHCDRQKLDNVRRLNLFIDVCDGIQHAHQKGVIHRDIKPSNILMTGAGGRPTPKVIDFGIAKATQMDLTDKTIYTEVQQLIGTPAYMSPEQAEMSGVDVDTRSDVYSLGVLLFELLTGRTPFETGDVPHDEVCRRIREVDPPRPSRQLQMLGAADSQELVARQGTDLPRIQKLVRGDLDWIVLKALDKDRTRRYQTASSLGADIRRFLADEPVSAVAPSRLYLMSKFVRRNTLAIVFAGTVVVLLVAATIVSAVFSIHATRSAEEARLAGAKSDRLAEQAEISLYYSRLQNAQNFVQNGDLRAAEALLRHAIPGIGEDDRRGWEWYYLQSLCLTDDTVLRGLRRRSMLKFSPEGSRLATRGIDGTIKIWDVASGRRYLTIPTGAGTDWLPFDWTADGEGLAWVGGDGSVRIGGAKDGKTVLTFEGHTTRPTRLESSPDGSRIATWAPDDRLRIWDARSGRELGSFPWSVPTAQSFSWSPSGRYLAGVNQMGRGMASLMLIDCHAWEVISGPSGVHWFFSFDARWNHEGSAMLFGTIPEGSEVARLCVWYPFEGRTVPIVPTSEVRWGGWSPDDRHLVTNRYDDRTFQFWDSRSGEEVHPPVEWPGRKILTSTAVRGDVLLWNVATMDRGPERFLHHGRGARRTVWDPHNRYLLSQGEGSEVRIWEPAAVGDEPIIIPVEDRVGSLRWSPDGSRIATAAVQRDPRLPATIAVYDVDGGGGQRTLVSKAGGHITWSPGGREIASGVHPGLLKTWDAATSEETRSLHREQIPDPPEIELIIRKAANLDWHPHGRRLAMGTALEGAVIWDLDEGTSVRIGEALSGVEALRWSPDGSRLAVAYRLAYQPIAVAEIHVFESGDYSQIWKTPLTKSKTFSDVAWAPDGGRIAVADGTSIRILDAESGADLFEHRGHVDLVNALGWSPDGTRLASGSDDGTIRIWRPGVHDEAFVLRGHMKGVLALDWSADGTRLASAGSDKTVRIWDAAGGYRWARDSRRLVDLDRRIASDASDGNVLLERAEIHLYAGQWERAADDLRTWFSGRDESTPSYFSAPPWYPTEWWISGPYDGNESEALPSEAILDPHDAGGGVPGRPWMLAHDASPEFLDFGGQEIGSPDKITGDTVVHCGLARVFSPVRREATMAVRADGRVQLWVNGREVVSGSGEVSRSLSDAPEEITLTFEAGWNTLFAKLECPVVADRRVLSVEIDPTDRP